MRASHHVRCETHPEHRVVLEVVDGQVALLDVQIGPECFAAQGWGPALEMIWRAWEEMQKAPPVPPPPQGN
jgi:hypothetical protein